MRKIICILFGVVLSALSLSGCSDKNLYIVPDDNCIVSVPENFLLGAPVNSQTECEKIELQIKGVDRAAGRDYYSVTKGAPLEIIRDYSWFDYDKPDYFGSGKVLTGYVIGEEKIMFQLYDVDFTISCRNNCDIEPIYENFTTIGQLYFALSGDETLSTEYLYEAKNFFNQDGSIKQIENLYYLYLNGEFTVYQDCWNTNLMVQNFEYAYRDGQSITAKFNADSIADRIAACSVCRYDRGGYFISSVTQGTVCGAKMHIGENELSLIFS